MYKIVKIGLIVISVISAILLFFMPDSDMPVAEAMESGGMNAMHWIAYILLAVAVAATVIFGLKNMISTPGGLKKSLMGIGGLLVLLGIAYGLSSGTDVSVDAMQRLGIDTSEGEIKSVGAGINMFGLLLLVAVVVIGWGAVKKATSK
ncbi:hypothetical protein FEE95_02585 [Maribacter algarum]|uniref:Uncharacterized protein n=1 Tax=Maribacter algarum (ex Zhang et al. 2020) TaxID=2578118 RepID=A0A5S3PTM1_9FLAO|nr:hypothetical protein [Maribacter algarum]TMM58336.1 hypothetical protein FEE95_02585 [Maribacter algarum]